MKFILIAIATLLLIPIVKAGTTADPSDGPSTKKPNSSEPGDPDGVSDSEGSDEEDGNKGGSDESGSGSGSSSTSSSESGSSGKKRKNVSGSDESSSGGSELPEADNPNGFDGMNNGDLGIIPGNWGSNCPIMKPLCNNDLYRTIMQRACKSSCKPESCLDRRPDLCKGWAKNNFCVSLFYSNLKQACSRTCNTCTPST